MSNEQMLILKLKTTKKIEIGLKTWFVVLYQQDKVN